MVRLPAVSGRFYPSNPSELTAAVRELTKNKQNSGNRRVKACLVPHAGYVYSGYVAGAVYSQIELPEKIVILGVRHFPRGAQVAILSSGAWRTPLGDAPIDEELAARLRANCALLQEDEVAHRSEHSLEVQLPFLQILKPKFQFVPIALGTLRFDDLVAVGEALGRTLATHKDDVLLLTTTDMNHHENDAITRMKDGRAIEQILALNARGLYDTCRNEGISMCGLGPTVAMLTALKFLEANRPQLVRYATSADTSGDFDSVVGYAGMIFS